MRLDLPVISVSFFFFETTNIFIEQAKEKQNRHRTIMFRTPVRVYLEDHYCMRWPVSTNILRFVASAKN